MLAPLSFRADFPFFTDNPDYVYLDNASTTLKPQTVVDSYADFYRKTGANVHRSTHRKGEEATLAFEGVREQLAGFFHCDRNEVIFSANCSDAINLAAQWLDLAPDDEVIVSEFEHHSNYLPWRQRAQTVMIPMTDDGVLDLAALQQAITPKTRLIALSMVSNVTGNVQPIAEAIAIARQHGVLTLVDAAQAVGHFAINLQQLPCDFLVLSAHKMLGPSGVGVIIGRQAFFDRLSPVRFGGGMVHEVAPDHLTFKAAPHGHEVGTPNIESVIAFGKALSYYEQRGFAAIGAHLDTLERTFRQRLRDYPFLRSPFPMAAHHVPIFTLLPENRMMDIQQLGRILSDSYGIAISVGMQCCQPFYLRRGVDAGLRVSLYLYNTLADIDHFFAAMDDMKGFLSHA